MVGRLGGGPPRLAGGYQSTDTQKHTRVKRCARTLVCAGTCRSRRRTAGDLRVNRWKSNGAPPCFSLSSVSTNWSGKQGICGEPGRALFVVCVALNKDWIYSKSPLLLRLLLFSSSAPPPSTLPHFYSPWLLPTPIKHYKHKNPQALKSRPGEEGWKGGGGTSGRNILLFTPLNHSVRRRRERWRGGYIVSDGLAD